MENVDTVGEEHVTKSDAKKSKKMNKLRKEAVEYMENIAKRGVIYLSRIPPFMKPNKARAIFEQYGEVTRLYLAEEDNAIRQKRKESGGNGSKQFGEGWIEFSDKKIAKTVAESLNNTSIGGKKGDFYHDDIWNVKYLSGFKWDFLTEKMAYEKRVKENKMKLALSQAKRTNAEMAELIEKTKVQKHVAERKRKRSEEAGDDEGGSGSAPTAAESMKKIARSFRQNKVLGDQYGEKETKVDPRFLTSVFAKSKSK